MEMKQVLKMMENIKVEIKTEKKMVGKRKEKLTNLGIFSIVEAKDFLQKMNKRLEEIKEEKDRISKNAEKYLEKMENS